MIGLGGPLRRRKTNVPDVGNQLESVGVVHNRTDNGTCGLQEDAYFEDLDIMSCRDRTSEFLSAVKSLQSRQVRIFFSDSMPACKLWQFLRYKTFYSVITCTAAVSSLIYLK